MVPLIYLSQSDHTDIVHVNCVKMAEITAERVTLRLLTEEGEALTVTRKRTPFIIFQLDGYGIEKIES